MHISMAPNPSHLEAVNPVVVGMARAAGTVASAPGKPRFEGASTSADPHPRRRGIPRDRASSPETLNLSRPGRATTPTARFHIIANNQVGFTATPTESYSTSYASGLARGFKIRSSTSTRTTRSRASKRRVSPGISRALPSRLLIDLIGYRRHGHNEGD
jgi:2-oxoglutarate dehydrogenase E1 component